MSERCAGPEAALEKGGDDDKLRSLVLANPRLRWIGKREHLCSMEQQRCTVFHEDGYAMVRDGAHLTFRSYEAFGAFLALQMGVK